MSSILDEIDAAVLAGQNWNYDPMARSVESFPLIVIFKRENAWRDQRWLRRMLSPSSERVYLERIGSGVPIVTRDRFLNLLGHAWGSHPDTLAKWLPVSVSDPYLGEELRRTVLSANGFSDGESSSSSDQTGVAQVEEDNAKAVDQPGVVAPQVGQESSDELLQAPPPVQITRDEYEGMKNDPNRVPDGHRFGVLSNPQNGSSYYFLCEKGWSVDLRPQNGKMYVFTRPSRYFVATPDPNETKINARMARAEVKAAQTEVMTNAELEVILQRMLI